MHVLQLCLQTHLLPHALPLDLQPLFLKFHIIQMINSLLSRLWVDIFKEAEPSIVCRIQRVLLQHELLQEAKRFAQLFHLLFCHVIWDASHKKLIVICVIILIVVCSRPGYDLALRPKAILSSRLIVLKI